jgi:hypothetical protein
MLIEQNGNIIPYQALYEKVKHSERCRAESCEKALLLHQYRRRVENGLGVFEEPPKAESPLSEIDKSILNDKKFRRAVLSFIKKSKEANLKQIKQHVKSTYTSDTLRYFFNWCIENNLLFMKEVIHQNKQKTCYYYIR